MIDIKTQTNRSTQFKRNITNVNLFVKGFEFGIVTSEAWGRFSHREKPYITLHIEGKDYDMPLEVFIDIMKKGIKKRTKKEDE